MRIFLLTVMCCLGFTLIAHSQQSDTQEKVSAIADRLIQKFKTSGPKEVFNALQTDRTAFREGKLELNDYIFKLGNGSIEPFFYHGDFYGSEKLLLELLSVSEADTTVPPAVLAELNRSMSVILVEKGDIRKALVFINKAEQQYKQASVEIPHMFYISTGNVYVNLDLTAKAREYFEESLRALQRAENPEGYRFLISYYSIANSLVIDNKNDEALEYLNKILVMGIPMMGEDNADLAQTYELMSVAYIKKRAFDKAKHYLEKTKKIYLNAFGEIHNRTAHIFGFFGEFYAAQEEYEKAHSFYLRRAAIEKELYGEKSGAIASTYQIIGDKLRKQKKYELAGTYYKNAIEAITIADFDGNIYTSDIGMYFLNSSDLAASYLESFRNSNTLKDLKLAQFQYKKVDSIIDNFRQNIHNSNDKISYSRKYHRIYFGAMESFLIEYEKTKNPLTLEKALEFSEKSRATMLRQALQESEVNKFLNLPQEVIAMEKELAIDRAYYQSGLANAKASKSKDSVEITEIQNRLFRVNRKQDSLRNTLKQQYPNYHVLKYKNKVIDLKEIQKNLKPKTTLLEYHYLKGISYVFIISKDNSFVYKLNVPNLEDDIEAFQSSILNKEIGLFKEKSHKLYQELIAPIANRLNGEELIIIPDGPLWNINFDLLLRRADVSNNPKDFSYLLRDFVIGYANSATALFATKSQERITNNGECLAFSFSGQEVTEGENMLRLSVLRNSNVDLPGTRKEISQIAKVLDGDYFYGALASEENFKMHALNYPILHLALHGEVNSEKPNDSRLFFTNTKRNIEDNYLYAHELFALNLPAELAVLSACNTGSGKIASGEGIMSLGNAFQYAGTKSLLLSKWELADGAAPELMEQFYRNLKKGVSKAKALQQAKLSYLEGASINRVNPFYWGSFYLLGDNTSIAFNTSKKPWFFILGGLILLLVCWFGYNKFKKKPN
ncbi:CHAT domain-containing tetratricopeptide repeat protein [uncultured Croceitalea sp.]|uniref:CHAT domain-containing protein n=1 Tax=uncultured Croceitalea sp. TaxID=1798908 RepID=UPI0033062B58